MRAGRAGVKTWSVLLACSSGRFMVFIIDAVDQNIAIDACIRSAIMECPEQSFSMTLAQEVTLTTPMKIMDSSE